MNKYDELNKLVGEVRIIEDEMPSTYKVINPTALHRWMQKQDQKLKNKIKSLPYITNGKVSTKKYLNRDDILKILKEE